MRLSLVLLLVTAPLAAQENPLFPRFSLTGGALPASFSTNVRIDPELTGEEGTLVRFEDDLGLDETRTLTRLGVQWRPFARHELAAIHFAASRRGFAEIDREITFRDEVYPVQALVTTHFDLDYWSATYTYWARRSDRDGLGITLGVANLEVDALIVAQTAGGTLNITETANTEVPVALAGVQGRLAFTDRLLGEASVSTLPRVTIGDYTGTALTAAASLEYRPLRWLGIGAAYHYFRLDVDVAAVDLTGSVDMSIRGPEAFVRFAF